MGERNRASVEICAAHREKFAALESRMASAILGAAKAAVDFQEYEIALHDAGIVATHSLAPNVPFTRV